MAKVFFTLEEEVTPYGTIVDIPSSMIDYDFSSEDGYYILEKAKNFIVNSLKQRGVPYDRVTLEIAGDWMAHWASF